MCITASGTNKAAGWTVAQTNINGTVDFVINGRVHKIYSNDTSGLTMFAPVSAGTLGNILVSGGTGSAPTWANPANLTVGTANKVSNSLSNGAGIVTFSYDGSSAKKSPLLQRLLPLLAVLLQMQQEIKLLYQSIQMVKYL